jgi:hypothetical protein
MKEHRAKHEQSFIIVSDAGVKDWLPGMTIRRLKRRSRGPIIEMKVGEW